MRVEYLHCDLCEKTHPVHIFQLVRRTFIISLGRIQVLDVVRIICLDNFAKNRKGEKVQYTLTILPAFLIPHSRVPVPVVKAAINLFTQSKISPVEAAMAMGCENAKSFTLYYSRAKERVALWISIILSHLFTIQNRSNDINLENTIPRKKGFLDNWEYCSDQYELFRAAYIKLPGSVYTEKEHYFTEMHARLTRMNTGLGP